MDIHRGGGEESVIDYVLVNEEMERAIEKIEIEDKVDSDHHPVVVELKGGGRVKGSGGKRKNNRGLWDAESRERFKKKLEEVEEIEGGLEEMLGEMEMVIRETMRKVGEEGRNEGRKGSGWWDEECKEKKRKSRRTLREWRKGEREGEDYRREKKEYRELCERKKKEENERWEKEMELVRTEGQVWNLISKERKMRAGVNEEIEMEEWEEYFKGLLGGVDSRVVWGREGERKGEEGEEEEVKREEIKKVIRKMKNGKAVGVDGIPNEVWKYGGDRAEEWVRKVCNRVWKGEGWPKKWREGLIVPIRKKGRGKVVEEYRGVTIMPTLYRVYAAVLAERLREEVERKGLMPPNQAGFRKGLGTMDCIYVMNYIVNRQIRRKEGKLVVMFVDLRVAFDSVDREILLKGMRERGVRKGLCERVKEMMRETRSRVKIGEELGKGFWTARGVRQGCPLSPILFNLLVADLEEELGKVKWGGVKLGEGKIYSLTYADDIALLAEDEGGMKSMMCRLEEYLEGKGLILNAGKSKIMRFRTRGGRMSKVNWWWKGKKIEEVKEYGYLGYRLQRNGGQEEQVKDRVGKAAAVMGQIWGIGKRRFGKDWGRRIWLFDRLVWTVASYGVEIWGWREREGIERLQERYLRWVLGVDGRTPGYLVRKEVQREKLRSVAGKRAWKFEERLERGEGSVLAQLCLKELTGRAGVVGREGSWEGERGKFLEERGLGRLGWEGGEGVRGGTMEEMLRREKMRQKEERWERIRNSRYNRWYASVKGEGIPGYLKQGWGESRWQRIAKFRLGNEVREGRYWEEERIRECRLCGNGVESWEHVWAECRDWKEGGVESWQEACSWVLGENGEGEGWMREVEEEREWMEGGRQMEDGGENGGWMNEGMEGKKK